MSLPDLLLRARAQNESSDDGLLSRAWDFAVARHGAQQRMSGEPYAVHLFETAALLADFGLDSTTVAAGLLHDTLEDTETTAPELAAAFGTELAQIVEGVTKIGALPIRDVEAQQSENVRKMLLAMADDLRVVLVKLADRTHNMRTLAHLPEDRRLRIARETLDVYAPLADRLGIGSWKAELEDLAFRHLQPDAFEALRRGVEERRRAGDPLLARACESLAAKLAEAHVRAEIETRVKHFWSIHRKMTERGRALSEVYDLFGLRLLTQTLRECYGALGVVQTMWKPLPQRFKDFVAMPKSNLYQSLHTTVLTEGGELLEIQIRTEAMHRIAERGVAAHWKYKAVPGGARPDPTSARELARLPELTAWQEENPPGPGFLQTFGRKLFEDEVFVFTPKGAVRSLPAGATPLDFAFDVHSDVGLRCTGAKVNGKLVPLRCALQNGDIVEILTSPAAHPSRDWLALVVTSRARNRLKQFFREKDALP